MPATLEQPKSPQVLFIGRLVPFKRVDRFLRIAKAINSVMPGVSFRIIGDGPLRSQLEQQTSSLGLSTNIEFIGEIPNSDISSFINQASLLMLTSDYEGFGRVVVESLTHRVPVIASSITGVEDIIVDGRSGYLVEKTNEQAFCQKALSLLIDRKLTHEFGEFGRQDVLKRFDPTTLTAKWIDMLMAAANRTVT